MIQAAQLSCLLSEIYDCAIEPGGWQKLPLTLASTFQSERCLIQTRDLATGTCQVLGSTANLLSGGVMQYADHYFKQDVWAPGAAKAGIGKACLSHDLVSEQDVRRSEFYQDFC